MEPWGKEYNGERLDNFEDNFKPEHTIDKLPDSEQYLALLESRLKSIRSKNNLLKNLQEYRADCFTRLLREGSQVDPIIGETEQDKLIEKQDLIK